MKVIIKTNSYCTTMSDLRAVDGSVIDMYHPMFCEECKKVFTLFKGASKGDDELKLDDGNGYWIASKMSKLDNLIEFSDAVEAEYTDITTVTYLDKLKGGIYDYHFVRRHIKDLVAVIGFGNLTLDEKIIVVRYCAADDADLISYFMDTYSLDMATAITKLKVYRAIDISNATKALKGRAEHPAMTFIAIKYLSESNASIFSDNIRNFISDLKTTAHLGLNYGQERDGIMDYIEDTNGYVGTGLSTFTFENGFTFEECSNEFKNFLVYGTIPEEFDVLSSQ